MKMKKKYVQPVSGRTEEILTVRTCEYAGQPVSVQDFFNAYRFSHIKKGAGPLKRLIKKTVESKLKGQFVWDKSAYQLITVNLMTAEILDSGAGMPFLLSKKAGEKLGHFIRSLPRRRAGKILQYSELYKNGVIPGNPVFISSDAVQLFTKSHPPADMIYLIDGARRLAAAAKAGIQYLEIAVMEKINPE